MAVDRFTENVITGMLSAVMWMKKSVSPLMHIHSDGASDAACCHDNMT